MDLTQVIVTALSVISTLGVAWFGYNQHTKDKSTDKKFEQLEEDKKERRAVVNANIGRIFGELHRLLHELHADRVYIAQPHPLSSQKYITITMEVTQHGVSSMAGYVQKLQLGEVAAFVKELATRDYRLYEDVFSIQDGKTQAIMCLGGTQKVAIRRLVNTSGDWIGSLFVESANESDFDITKVELGMRGSGNLIQYILPPYEE